MTKAEQQRSEYERQILDLAKFIVIDMNMGEPQDSAPAAKRFYGFAASGWDGEQFQEDRKEDIIESAVLYMRAQHQKPGSDMGAYQQLWDACQALEKHWDKYGILGSEHNNPY